MKVLRIAPGENAVRGRVAAHLVHRASEAGSASSRLQSTRRCSSHCSVPTSSGSVVRRLRSRQRTRRRRQRATPGTPVSAFPASVSASSAGSDAHVSGPMACPSRRFSASDRVRRAGRGAGRPGATATSRLRAAVSTSRWHSLPSAAGSDPKSFSSRWICAGMGGAGGQGAGRLTGG